jgi:hypothetical protein
MFGFFQQSFLTGGSDKRIQFWNFELKDEQENNSKKVKFCLYHVTQEIQIPPIGINTLLFLSTSIL